MLASLGALVAWGACGRFPDPTEHLGGAGGAASNAGGTTWGSGASAALGGGGGEGPVLVSCGEPPVVTGAFSKAALLEASALCAEWHYCSFENAAARLQQSVASWAEDPSETHRAQAQHDFRFAQSTWSRVELFQYGPAGSRATSDPYHGEGYRDRIYSWPSLARCRVEEQIASERYLATGMDELLPTARGLHAVEYVLFYPGADHGCLSTSSTARTWATLSATEIDARKRRYGAAVAEDVLGLTRALRELWAPTGGNFRQKLVDAVGYDKPAIDNRQEALNIVAWSFIYIEKEVKDWKLAHPAGLNPDAPLTGFEAPYAQQAVQSLRANLRAFRSLFEGCGPGGAGLGFDDWLRAAGHGDLADDMIAAWAHAQAAADAFPAFHQATQPDFLALHAAVKQLTDLIKNDFLAGAGSPLNLSMPEGFEGDND